MKLTRLMRTGFAVARSSSVATQVEVQECDEQTHNDQCENAIQNARTLSFRGAPSPLNGGGH